MNSSLFTLKNIETGYRLKVILRNSRKAGKSYRTIASELSTKGTSVGYTAVQQWCRALDIN